jgi:hypothetical protein
MKSRKLKPQFAKRKRAFDTVMAMYRQAQDITGGMGAVNMSNEGKGTSYLVQPSLTDFRCDVERVINKCVTAQDAVVRFRASYINYDSEEQMDIERYADKVIGSGRHGLEQGIGALFIKQGIYPLYEKGGYFNTIRQPRGSV